MNFFELLGSLSLSEPNQFTEKYVGAYRAITQFSEKVMNLYQELNAWWEDTGIHVCETINKLAEPFYSEEKRQELIDCYKGWGRFGWTMNSKIRSTVFESLPSTQAEADAIMQKYCSVENVSDMQQSIVEQGVNQTDLEEAFTCYKNGMYKASALIVFSLLDHELISMGYRKTKRDGTPGRLKVGLSAASNHYQEKQTDVQKAFLVVQLWFLNIMETLMALFADADDFQSGPDMINRNYVSHGMSKRIVTEIDCFKAWSALYSLTALLPHLEEAIE